METWDDGCHIPDEYSDEQRLNEGLLGKQRGEGLSDLLKPLAGPQDRHARSSKRQFCENRNPNRDVGQRSKSQDNVSSQDRPEQPPGALPVVQDQLGRGSGEQYEDDERGK